MASAKMPLFLVVQKCFFLFCHLLPTHVSCFQGTKLRWRGFAWDLVSNFVFIVISPAGGIVCILNAVNRRMKS